MVEQEENIQIDLPLQSIDRLKKFMLNTINSDYVKMRDFLYVIIRIPVEYPQQQMVARLWESVPQVYSERQSALTYGQNGHIMAECHVHIF